MALGHSPSIVTSGLVFCVDVANIKSNPNNTNIYDISGVGNSCTISGPITFDTANNMGALTLNGANTWVTVAKPLSGGNTTPFTLMAVARTNTASSWQTVLGTVGTFRQIGFLNSTFQFGGNGGAGNLFVAGGTTSVGQWCHLAMTFDGTTAYGYFNKAQTTGNIGANAGTIGNSVLGSYNGGNEILNGNIAMAQIYNRALTAAEVTQNFNAIRGRFGL